MATVERTALILRGESTVAVLRSPIEARLVTMGFTVVQSASLDIESDTAKRPVGCDEGKNVVLLLQRHRALQTLCEVVGPEGDGVPASPVSLQCMYGKQAVWCPRDATQASSLIASVWPALAPSTDSRDVDSEEEQPGSQSPPRERRVFTYSGNDTPNKTTNTVTGGMPTSFSSSSVTSSDAAARGLPASFSSASVTSSDAARPSSVTRSTSTGGPSILSLSQSHAGFKARPLPESTLNPTSVPKMSKTVALRLGLPWSPPRHRSSLGNSSSNPVPAVNRRTSSDMAPASLANPTVAPRANRAALLRAGVAPESLDEKPRSKRDEADVFADTPGHKWRRQSLQGPPVASTLPPTVAVRMTRASTLRHSSEMSVIPPEMIKTLRRQSSSTAERGYGDVAGYKRLERVAVESTKEPEVSVRPTRASALRAAQQALEGTSPSMMRAKTAMGVVGELGHVAEEVEQDENVEETVEMRRAKTFQGVPGHKRSVPVSVASIKSPTLAPRLNRAAALRTGGTPQASLSPAPLMKKSPSMNKVVTIQRPASELSMAKGSMTGSGGTPTLTSTTKPKSKLAKAITATLAPTFAPRLNRAAALRAAKGAVVNTTPSPVLVVNDGLRSSTNRRSSTLGKSGGTKVFKSKDASDVVASLEDVSLNQRQVSTPPTQVDEDGQMVNDTSEVIEMF